MHKDARIDGISEEDAVPWEQVDEEDQDEGDDDDADGNAVLPQICMSWALRKTTK